MCTPLAKLAIGLSATMATAFYYLAAAPPASAAIDVCGPGNFSDECVKGQQSTSASSSTSLRDPVPAAPALEQQPSPDPLSAAPTVEQEPSPDPLSAAPAVEQEPSPDPLSAAPVVEQQPSPDPLSAAPIVEQSPEPTLDTVAPTPPAVESPLTAPEPTGQLPETQPPDVITNPIVLPAPIVAPTPNFPNIYENTSVRTTAIPEPGTVVALLLTGAGIIGFGRKRNKQVGQQR
ncbi:PEP-CTERM sorting domain-containing protein [Microcoleus sp. F4-D5]|uniref:PEP-CTERM sorting domain-containing protein n=1 Tax=Microcoleus sp. F4-D5 TaxID=2818760 RepID=UPI002FD0E0D3